MEKFPNRDEYEELIRLEEEIEKLLSSPEIQETEREYVESFYYNLVKEVSNFIRERKVGNLLVLDRSARPIGSALKTYWRIRYPKEKSPNIYFLNPNPFKKNFSEEELSKKFQEEHPYLFLGKGESTMVFDVCSHSGDTLSQVTDGLDKAGFSDVYFGLIFDDRNDYEKERLPLDFCFEENSKDTCYPFGSEEFLTKGDSLHVEVADPNEKAQKIKEYVMYEEETISVADYLYPYDDERRRQFIMERLTLVPKEIVTTMARIRLGESIGPLEDKRQARGVRQELQEVIKRKLEEEIVDI